MVGQEDFPHLPQEKKNGITNTDQRQLRDMAFPNVTISLHFTTSTRLKVPSSWIVRCSAGLKKTFEPRLVKFVGKLVTTITVQPGTSVIMPAKGRGGYASFRRNNDE